MSEQRPERNIASYKGEPSSPTRGLSEASLRELSTLVNLYDESKAKRFDCRRVWVLLGVWAAAACDVVSVGSHGRHILKATAAMSLNSTCGSASSFIWFEVSRSATNTILTIDSSHHRIVRFLYSVTFWLALVFVFAHQVKLGGFYSAATLRRKARYLDLSGLYALAENEQGKHCIGAALHTAVPEVLLGDLERKSTRSAATCGVWAASRSTSSSTAATAPR